MIPLCQIPDPAILHAKATSLVSHSTAKIGYSRSSISSVMTGGRVSKKREKREGEEKEESRNTILVFSDFITIEDIFLFSLPLFV